VEKGVRLLAVKRPKSAVLELQRALSLASEDPEILNDYGAALSMLGNREAAIQQFRHALRLDPCSTTSRVNLELLGLADVVPCR
jgi:Flp pilus assembly protein TadD